MLAALALSAALTSIREAGASPACAYTGGAATVALSGRPFASEPSADGCWLFVSLTSEGGGRGGIAVLHNEVARFVVQRTVPFENGATGLALSHDGSRLFAASGDSVRVFDVAKLETADAKPEVGRVPEGAGASTIYVALSIDHHLLFASDEGAARITVSDVQRGEREGFGVRTVIGRIPQGLAPVGLVLSPDGARLYATSQQAGSSPAFPVRCRPEGGGGGPEHSEGALSVIDVAKAAVAPPHALLAALPAGCNPVRVALSADGKTAWVTARGENALYAITFADPAVPARATRLKQAVGDSPVG